jgi:predicted kinase
MDLNYLERRLEEERQRIAEATCPEAARAHRELAEEYEVRIAVLRGARRPTLHLVTR